MPPAPDGSRSRPSPRAFSSSSSSSTRRSSSRISSSAAWRRASASSRSRFFQLAALLLLAPIVILEVLVYAPLRAGRDAAGLLSGRPRLVRHAQPLLDGAARGRGVAAEPRARRHARDLDHLRRERARRPLRARLRRRRPPAAGRSHGRHRVARRRGRGPRGARLREGRRRPAARSWPGRGAAGSTSGASSAGAPPRSSPSATRGRSAWRPARSTRSASGSRPSSCTRACFVLESSDPALHAPADGRFPPHDRRPHRARAPGPERSGRRSRSSRSATGNAPRPSNQILEISNDLKKNRTLDDLFPSIASAVAKGLGFQQVVLSLYDRERNVFSPRAHFGLDDRWPDLRQRDVPAEEITRHWTERNRVSKSFHVRDRSAREAAPAVAAARQVVTAGDERLAPGRAPLDPPLRRRPPARMPLGRRPEERRDPHARDDPIARDLRQPGRRRDRERPVLQRGPRAIDPRLADRRLQPPPLPGSPAARARPRRAARPPADRPDARHRRLQGDQRPIRPSRRRRRSSRASSARSAARSAATWTCSPATAATSSRSCCPRRPISEAVLVAERVRRRVDERLFRMPDSREILRATVSIGLATYPDDADREEGPRREGRRRALPRQARRQERRRRDVRAGAGAAAAAAALTVASLASGVCARRAHRRAARRTALDRAPDSRRSLRSRGADLLPRFARETIRAANFRQSAVSHSPLPRRGRGSG